MPSESCMFPCTNAVVKKRPCSGDRWHQISPKNHLKGGSSPQKSGKTVFFVFWLVWGPVVVWIPYPGSPYEKDWKTCLGRAPNHWAEPHPQFKH